MQYPLQHIQSVILYENLAELLLHKLHFIEEFEDYELSDEWKESKLLYFRTPEALTFWISQEVPEIGLVIDEIAPDDARVIGLELFRTLLNERGYIFPNGEIVVVCDTPEEQTVNIYGDEKAELVDIEELYAHYEDFFRKIKLTGALIGIGCVLGIVYLIRRR